MSQLPAIFLFHREFRLHDNTGLNAIARSGKRILPVFIFDPCQIDPKRNKYFSHGSVQFMIESLRELDSDIKKLGGKILFMHGDTLTVLRKLLRDMPYDEIHSHEDVTPFADSRDSSIRDFCERKNVAFIQHQDYDLYDLREGLIKGRPYLVFTPFYRYSQKNLRVRPVDTFKLQSKHFVSARGLDKVKDKESVRQLDRYYIYNPNIELRGGRKNGLERIDNLKTMVDYEDKRDYFSRENVSSKLSAYLKYGVVSVREVYWRLFDLFGPEHGLIRELNWKCFYNRVSKFIPRVLQGKALKPQYDNVKWSWDKKTFAKLCKGETGTPLVDASVRNLLTTNWVSNRLRMVFAMYATKDLLLHWSLPERFYANHLVDYDPSANNGGWLFSCSAGADSSPYIRLFSPSRQGEKFDPDAKYIKYWIPELRDVPAKDIHNWDNKWQLYQGQVKYPRPMIYHKEAAERAKKVIAEGVFTRRK